MEGGKWIELLTFWRVVADHGQWMERETLWFGKVRILEASITAWARILKEDRRQRKTIDGLP